LENLNSEELKAIIETRRCIAYFEKITDQENSEVLWSCYGEPDTNQVIVKLEKGNKSFYNAVQSPVVSPPMRDRIWGIDILDEQEAMKLSERMWERYNDQLDND
jgi:hypothetical protein